MLTADLIDARRKDGELLLRPLDRAARDEALKVAEALLDAARALVGKRREELDEAWDAATSDAASKRFKVAAGLRKLAADACSFEADVDVDPPALRRALFTLAAATRRALPDGARFDRDAVLNDAARELGLAPAALGAGLFADLRAEHVLRAAPTLDAPALVEAWELGQAQAVLLTAVRVTIDVTHASPGLVRAFFGKLKFHRLLFSAERTEDGFRVVVDGPYSMFDAVTKYGLELALILPALRALERWSLVADVKWGKAREPLVFRLASEDRPKTGPSEPRAKPQKGKRRSGERAPEVVELHLSDEVRELAAAIERLGAGWHARPASVVLDVPGGGVCVPDLELRRDGDDAPVYVEVLGYWSRDAVFRRVELAERGLGAPVVFALSSRLRVSAQVLDADVPASLYVFKGKMSPRAVVEHAARLADGRR